MPFVEILARGARSGVQTISPISLPTGITSVALWLDRADWTDSTFVSWLLELSLDGGGTWAGLGGGGGVGGTVTAAPAVVGRAAMTAMGASLLDGARALKFSGSRRSIPQPANPSRQVRGTITISGSVTIRALVEWA